MTDEIFASKHLDVNSVATIDDRCYVLTFNEYCRYGILNTTENQQIFNYKNVLFLPRYRKRLKQLQEALPSKPLLSLSGSAMHNNNAAGNIAGAVWNGKPTTEQNRPASPGKISPEVVFFCKKVYDFRQKRIMKNPSQQLRLRSTTTTISRNNKEQLQEELVPKDDAPPPPPVVECSPPPQVPVSQVPQSTTTPPPPSPVITTLSTSTQTDDEPIDNNNVIEKKFWTISLSVVSFQYQNNDDAVINLQPDQSKLL